MSAKRTFRAVLLTFVITLVAIAWQQKTLMAGEPVNEVLTLAQGGGLPAMAALPESDHFLLIWDMGLEPIDGTNLRARFVDSSGQQVGPDFAPTSHHEQGGIPSLAPNPTAGEFLLTWWDFQEDTGDIYGQRLAGNGNLIGEAFLIAKASNFENWPPAVAYNPVSNAYLVVWYQIEGQPTESSIYGQRVTADGQLVGDRFRISDEGTPEVRPAIAANSATGQYLVTWSLIGPTLDAQLFGQHLTAEGTQLGEPILVGQGDKPAVTYNAISNEYLVVYTHSLSPGTGYQAQAARILPDGSVVSDIPVSEPGNSKQYSDVASNAAGGYLVVWEGPANGDLMTTVLGRELSSKGEAAGTPWSLSDPVGQNITYPALAFNSRTNVYLVAWEERVAGVRMVRGRIFKADQVPPPPTGLVNGDFEAGFYPIMGQSIANGWAPYTLIGEPTIAGEQFTVHGGRWAHKISGYAPFTAGVAQVIEVQPGTTYQITAYYQLYPPGDGQAFLGVQDGALPPRWVGDSWPGVWRQLSQTVTATSDRLTISLQGSNGADPNTNVYFDDVTVVPVILP